MDISLTKQQCFELGAFLSAPSKSFLNVTEVRKASSARKAFQSAVQDYSKYFSDLAKESKEKEEEFKEKFQIFIRTPIDGVMPTKEAQELEAARQYKEMSEVMKGYQKQGEDHKNVEGKVKVAVTLSKNDISFLKIYFERAAVQCPFWQDGDSLEEIATLLETV